MHGKKQLAVRCVLRHLEAIVAGLGDIGVVARDKQEAVCVPAAEGAYQLYEFAVYLVGGFVAFILAENSAGACYFLIVELVAEFLVGGFEYQLVGAVGKMLAYLRPHCLIHFHCLVAGLLLCGAEHTPPAAVPVVVYYDVHISVERPCHHFVNPVHQSGIYGIVTALVVHAVSPRNRDTYSVESGGFHSLDHLLSSPGLTPHYLSGGRA